MRKFLMSYAASVLTFSIGWTLIGFIFDPNHFELSNLFDVIRMLIIYGSIPALVACLIGEALYRKIKRCQELQIGMPVFIGVAIVYTFIISLSTRPYPFSTFFDFVIPVIMGSLAFYSIRRNFKIVNISR